MSELESNIPSLADIIPWFKQLNGYLSDLVEACIREKYTDLIHGMQAWYRKLIRKVYQALPEFKNEWNFEGYIGPIPRTSEGSKANNNWFQVAALFASVSHYI